MPQRTLRLVLVIWLTLLIALTYSQSPAHADGLLVSPPSGLPGTTFQIQGSGFNANEGVELWARYPDGRILQSASATADGSGAASLQISTDSSYPFGTYVLMAHGKSSGNNVFGRLTIGSPGSSGAVTGTAFCQGQNFTVPGFASGEPVIFTAQLPNGSVQVLGSVTADGSGNASITIPLQPNLPIGTYVITAQGVASGHQTSDTLNFDGSTLSGSNCSMSLLGSFPGGSVLTPKNIVNFRGPGVYLGTDPNSLYYFGCDWKWRSFGGIIYFLVLGFKPSEPVRVSYEILLVQGLTYYATVNADGNGNAAFAVNSIPMPPGHYHWWFTSPSASYCGHYDHS
jgi:hypothetical protein